MPTPGDYARALSQFYAADQEVKLLSAQLATFSERLSRFPGETCFIDIDDEAQPPLDQLIQGARWYASEFPSPDAIQLALRRRHDARMVCERVRGGLSAQQIRGAPPLPR